MCKSLIVAMLLAGVGGLWGCGYHLVGTSSFLPEDLKLLYLDKFSNLTSWPDVDQRLDEALAREWVRRRRFELLERRDRAQLAIEGVVQSITMVPVALDDHGRATEYQMTLTVSARLVDIRGEEPIVLWEDKAFSRRTSYDVDVSAVDYFDRQVQAMEVVSQDLARALVTAVLEGF
ncbi:MAG: hypothetical protein K8R59_14180 [Thermoanaerobaculales bacterium]|nr:hypothetical protein [Thermoanaerobaculales bacterium]